MKSATRWRTLALAGCLCLPGVLAQEAAGVDAQALEAAASIIRASGRSGGLCVVAGAVDAALPVALARRGNFTVHCLCPDQATCDRVRQEIRSQGLYGTVSAVVHGPGRLPYAANLVNILVANRSSTALTAVDVFRVLAPLGTAWIGKLAADGPQGWAGKVAGAHRALGMTDVAVVEESGTWVTARKPWPGDIDEWGHYLHGADGNPVARDRVVGPPEHYQWLAGPLWQRSHETDSSLSTIVTARGRLFYILDEAPIGLPGDHPLPDKWSLIARDAFNGVLLWRVPIRRWGWREWKPTWFNTRPGDVPLNVQKRLVAIGDKVYVTLGYKAPVSELDARTGDILKTYADTAPTGEILHHDGALVLSVYAENGLRVMSVDAASGSVNWVSEGVYAGSTVDYIKWSSKAGRGIAPKLDPAANIATDGEVVALLDGPRVAGLGFRTGKEKWRTTFPEDEADRRAGAVNTKGNLWVGTMIVSDGVVVHASPNKLAGLSSETGEVLWTQPKKYIGHLWYEWKDVFVIDGLVWSWSAELGEGVFQIGGNRKQRTLHPKSVRGYDIRTGKLEKDVPLGTIFNAHHHHRCYRNKATLRYILASRRGTEYVDLEGGKHTVHNWVRGTCHVGMMPANGLQYAPIHPCACYIDEKLNGMNALAPLRPDEVVGEEAEAAQRHERGPAYGDVSGPEAGDDDWPQFRRDSMRTGAVATQIAAELVPAWRTRIGRKLSAPIAAAGRVFVSLVDEHHVVCLDAGDGRIVWASATGGRVDSPPTYVKGSAIVGSADGWVYCLRAADGELAWRFRGAPGERLMAAHGQIESSWPVHGSVLVQEGKAYFAAGRSSQLDGGIRVYAIDAVTGDLRHTAKLAGPDYSVGDFKENFRLPMGSLPDVLMGDGSGIYMRTKAFDGELKPKPGRPPLQTRGGLLEDSYFKRTPWTFGLNKNYARLIVHDRRSVYYVRMFDTLRGLDPTVYFTPGRKGYLLFARNVDGTDNTWTRRVPVRIRAMVLTPKRLVVTGPPDVVEADDPLGAFEGRKGGVLLVLDSGSGEELAKLTLPSPPVFNGAAAAAGRLFVAQEDGTVTCYAEP